MIKPLSALLLSVCGFVYGLMIFYLPFFAIALPLLFFVSLNSVIAVSAWLMSEIYLGNFQLFGANPRSIIAIVIGIIFLYREMIFFKGENVKRTFELLKIPMIMLGLGVITNILGGAEFYDYLRWFITFISNLFFVLLLGFGIRNSKQFRQVIFIFLIIVIIDCGIGVLQYLGVEQAYNIREMISKYEIYSPVGRILGLSRNIIEYAYVLLMAFFVFAGNAFGKQTKYKALMNLGLLITGVTLFVNATRSGIGGIFIALGIYLIFHRRIFHEKTMISRRKVVVVLCSLGLVFLTLFFVFQNNVEGGDIFSKKWLTLQDTSAVGRLSRFQLALDVSIHHPLGIGTANYEKYMYKYWTRLPVNYGISLEEFSVHNNFLRTVLQFGFLGGILLLIFLWKLFKKMYVLFGRAKDPYVQNFILGGFYFLFAYCVQIFFHNFGPFDGDNLFWFFVGLLVCANNIVAKEEAESESA